MTEGLRPSRVSVREEGRTTFLSDENRNSAMRFRSRTRSSSAEEVEAMPFARDLGLIDDHQEWTPEEWPESRPGEIPIRRLSYPVMQWLHQQGLLMTGWEKYPHLFLDFSDDLFSLATMQPLDFRWRRKEGEDRSGPGARLQRRPQELELIVGKLKTLKLDNNKLRDSDFDPAKDVGIASSAFASLRTLSLSKNLLVYPIIVLPRLKELDLSHNRLIQVPVLSGLAQLETLNLSHNKIEELEPKSFRDGKASNLRSLDLRFNRLQVFPKDLHGVFDEFARSSQMHTLRLSQNPFCCIFPEYHMLAALSMPRLRSLDKVTLTGHWRSELLRYGGSFFGMAVSNYVTGDGKLLESVNSVRSFPDSAAEPLPEVNRLLQLKLGVEVSSMDKARVFFLQDRVEDLAGQVKDRERIADNGGLGVGVSRKTIQRSRMATTDQEIPLLSSMTHELDSAIAGHTLIINSSTIVFQKASHLASLAADRVEAMFDDIKVKMNVKTGKMDPHLLRVAREDASKTFAEQVCMLAERHPDLRSILIRTLAKCGSISNEIGPPCMNSLALLAQADDETRRAVLEVTQEIILPAMQEGQIVEVANMNCEGMEDILESAVPEISAAVKSILRSGVNSKMLVKMMRSCEAAIRLLEIAVSSEAAALRVIKEDVLKAIVEYLSIDSVFLDKSACWIFVSGVHVLLGCLEHHRKEALASLSSAGLSTHLELLQNMEELGKSKETPGPALCRKAGSTMELLASLAQEDDTLDELMAYGNGARVSIEENPFVRVALAAPSAPSTADPVQLAGAMKCLITVLYNEKQRNRFGKYIVSHLELMDKKKNKIWGYIDGTHWREISRSCEMYKKHEENAKDPSRGYGTSELMNFQGVTDPNRIRNVFMHKMLVSVIDFLKAFSALADGDSKELCTRVSQVFNEMGRESVLFKLLQVPSTEVQEAVMGCLQHARLEELDDEEVQQLLHMLNPEIVESGERLLGAVLRNLTQFLEKDGEAADKFRRNHTRSVIDRTFKVLCTNCSRETFGNPDEEEQKITLSEQCVQVLITASFQPLLRRHLRGEVAKDFLKMLKDHETLDSWNCRDMNLELTWTGRHLDLLLSCLNTASPMCLRNDMKQAFRVFHRIANVMAGVGDTPDMARTAEERAAEETVMWNEKLMRQEANLLDDVAYDDQLQQQLIFFSFSGIERMEAQRHSERLKSCSDATLELRAHFSDVQQQIDQRINVLEKRLQQAEQFSERGLDAILATTEGRILEFLAEGEAERARLWYQMSVLFPRFIQENDNGKERMSMNEARAFALDVRLDNLEDYIVKNSNHPSTFSVGRSSHRPSRRLSFRPGIPETGEHCEAATSGAGSDSDAAGSSPRKSASSFDPRSPLSLPSFDPRRSSCFEPRFSLPPEPFKATEKHRGSRLHEVLRNLQEDLTPSSPSPHLGDPGDVPPTLLVKAPRLSTSMVSFEDEKNHAQAAQIEDPEDPPSPTAGSEHFYDGEGGPSFGTTADVASLLFPADGPETVPEVPEDVGPEVGEAQAQPGAAARPAWNGRRSLQEALSDVMDETRNLGTGEVQLIRALNPRSPNTWLIGDAAAGRVILGQEPPLPHPATLRSPPSRHSAFRPRDLRLP